MEKDLKELAEKYKSLSDMEKMDLQIQTHGQVTSEWFLNRAEEIDNLMNCSWFYVDKLGVEVGGDGRLRMEENLFTFIPEDVTRDDLQQASKLISEYFSTIIEFLAHPERIEADIPDEVDKDEWGSEEFLLGLLGRRRGDDFDLFE